MRQSLMNGLAVSFTCATSIEVGDVVEISADNTVAVPSGAGSTKIVGTVVSHAASATTCTVETRFRERRDDRVSGAAVAVGPFVWDASMKAIAYNSNTHDPSAIAGLVITAASAGDETVETLEY